MPVIFCRVRAGFWSHQKGFGSQPTTKIWLKQRAAGQGRGHLVACTRSSGMAVLVFDVSPPYLLPSLQGESAVS